MSDLLNQASLVMVPSGYKEDTVYSVVPSDGSGDLTFTRASNGTRVNSAGLVEVVPWNLLVMSEDFTNAAYTNINVTVTANNTTAPNGTLTADKLEFTTSASFIYQPNSGTNSSTGCISIYLKADANTQIYIASNDLNNWGTGVQLLCNVTTEWQRFEIGGVGSNVDAFKSWVIGTVNPSTGGTGLSSRTIYAWGAQTNIGTTAKPYFPTTDRLNVPRLTYQNGGGGCPSLLLEKQSTNLITYSEQFDNANWQKYQSTISANATTSPDGNTNADKIVENSLSGLHYVSQFVGSAGTYTLSVYAKADTRDWIYLTTYDGVADRGAFFNVSTGVVGNIDTGVTASIQSVGNGWYRCIVTATPVTNFSSSVQLATANGTRSYTGNGTSGLFIWGAQLEESSYATSYIPTTSSSATRVADACFKTGISSLIGQTSGTILWDLQVDQLLSNENILNIDNGSFGNTIYFLKTTANSILVDVWAGGTQQCVLSYSLPSVGRYKVAFAYADNDFALYVNGVSRGTDSSGSVPATSRLQMGNGALGSSDGKVNELVLFPTRLTNAELASLTTI